MQRKGSGNDTCFTKVHPVTLRKLVEARPPATEIAVYLALTRYSEMRNGRVSRPVCDIAEEVGLSVKYAMNCITRLKTLRYFDWNGHAVPVLTTLRRACRGHAAKYRDNITLYRLYPNEEPPEGAVIEQPYKDCIMDDLPEILGGSGGMVSDTKKEDMTPDELELMQAWQRNRQG